jgi:hypothetical protein
MKLYDLKKQKIKRAPTKTFKEFIEEFNVERYSFQSTLARRNGPKPEKVNGGNSYYNVSEMRKWWQIQLEAKNEKIK